ncbi:MAG: alpha/beta fold hydrolase [Nitratireductor sp.]
MSASGERRLAMPGIMPDTVAHRSSWSETMPYVEANGARLHYLDEGSGPHTVVFSHGLLFRGEMFRAQIDRLKPHYRCIAYDHRGQGDSAIAPDGYDMDTLAEDAAALIVALDAGPCHFVGLSMGGFVGMRLALRRPELLRSLSLFDTAADAEPAGNIPRYRTLNLIARWFGLNIVSGRIMPIMFGKTYLDNPARAAEREMWRKRIVSADRTGITRAVAGVIDRQGLGETIAAIKTPTLILVGEEDVATPPERSEIMHRLIPGSKLVRIPNAGHSSTIEAPEAVNAALEAFLAAHDA